MQTNNYFFKTCFTNTGCTSQKQKLNKNRTGKKGTIKCRSKIIMALQKINRDTPQYIIFNNPFFSQLIITFFSMFCSFAILVNTIFTNFQSFFAIFFGSHMLHTFTNKLLILFGKTIPFPFQKSEENRCNHTYNCKKDNKELNNVCQYIFVRAHHNHLLDIYHLTNVLFC